MQKRIGKAIGKARRALAAVFALAVALVPMAASAATSADVLTEIDKGVYAAGDVPAAFRQAAETFLQQNDTQLTDAQRDVLVNYVASIATHYRATGKTAYRDMTDAERQQLIGLASAAATAVGGSVSLIDLGGHTQINLVGPSGNVVTMDAALPVELVASTPAPAPAPAPAPSSSPVKQTGADHGAATAAALALVAAFGAAFVYARKSGLFAAGVSQGN